MEPEIVAIGNVGATSQILEVVCRTTGMGFAAVARVTEDRWVCCQVRDEIAFGLKPGGELPVETTICNTVRIGQKHVVIEDVSNDEFYKDHAIPKVYGFQSYISVPIWRRNGDFFGTLCAIDPRPARLTAPEVVDMFTLFADLIGFHLDALDDLEDSNRALLDAQQTAEVRDQFIAILGHDLRNPLGSIDAGAAILSKCHTDERSVRTLTLMRRSVRRMAGLIDDVLDFARARLGAGITVTRVMDDGVVSALEHVIEELRSAHPDHVIESDLTIDVPLCCDRARVGQVLSNLLANAISHGDPSTPIRIRAAVNATTFELAVINSGSAIDAQTRGHLFQPFFRSSVKKDKQGLGLGLYIASEIAKAHGGTLSVRSTDDHTAFTLTFPVLA